MTNRARLTVFGSIGNSDLGDDAYLIATMESIHSRLGEVDWLILSGDPKETENRANQPSLLGFMRPNPPGATGMGVYYRSLRQMLECIHWGLFNVRTGRIPGWFQPETQRLIRSLLDANAVTNFGGGFLNEDYRRAFLSEIIFLWLCERMNKPVALLAQSLGPYYHRCSRRWAAAALNRVNVLTIREPDSFRTCQSLHLSGPIVEMTADSAVLLRPLPQEEVLRFGEQLGIAHEDKVIGLSVRQWIYPGSKDPLRKQVKYVSTLAAVASQLMGELNAHVILVPSSTRPNDEAVCEDVRNRIPDNSRAYVCGDGTDLSVVRKAIARCDLFIATRLHPLIFSTSCSIPSVAISYTPKVSGYMQLLDREDYVCPIENLNEEEILTMCRRLWERRAHEKEDLRRKMESLRRKAQRNVDLLIDLLGANTTKGRESNGH